MSKPTTYRSDGGRWAKARQTYLLHHPFCVLCAKDGKAVAATHVDHITPHKNDQKLFWNKQNWQGLCSTHHNSWKQHLERTGHERGCTEDGTPTDPKHHWKKENELAIEQNRMALANRPTGFRHTVVKAS